MSFAVYFQLQAGLQYTLKKLEENEEAMEGWEAVLLSDPAKGQEMLSQYHIVKAEYSPLVETFKHAMELLLLTMLSAPGA